MDAALRPQIAEKRSTYFQVSILVLVDAALRPSSSLDQVRCHTVSILVLVDAALRQDNSTEAAPIRDVVSILVLVDAALRQSIDGVVNLMANRFNPCFSGCRPATGIE